MAVFYEIKVEGLLDECWSDWLDGMRITHLQEGNTLISGRVSDQSALYGMFSCFRDMNLSLISVNRMEASK